MNCQYWCIVVVVKNIDICEYDIVDFDDYFQYYGGMVVIVWVFMG